MTEYGQESFFKEEPGNFLRERRMHYLMVNSIAKRVRQLQLGERPLVTLPDGTRDPIRVATQEFLDGQLEIVPRVLHHDEQESEPVTEID